MHQFPQSISFKNWRTWFWWLHRWINYKWKAGKKIWMV